MKNSIPELIARAYFADNKKWGPSGAGLSKEETVSFRAGRIAPILALISALPFAVATSAAAEVSEITVAQQFGVSFLPLMVMEKQGLVEKHAALAGLGGVKVVWTKVAGPSVM